jgi:hypothetical protein
VQRVRFREVRPGEARRVQRQHRLERQVLERWVRFREVPQGEARRVQRRYRLERQVLARRVRFREVPQCELRRVQHQQVRRGVALRACQRLVEWI